MSKTWKQWEGHIFEGKFALVRYMGGSDQGAVFITDRHDGERLVKAAIKLIPADPETGNLQLSRWQIAAELSHPHLIPIYEMGRSELAGVPIVYAVMECAEENLAQVLTVRALTQAEAREMLDSVLNVLDYLHGRGLVHGRIKPANIMASGDLLKVSSDTLCRAGEFPIGREYRDKYDAPESIDGVSQEPQPMSPAADVWSLGITIVEALTQSLPAIQTDESQDPALPGSLQEPFLDVARHCLLIEPQRRWTDTQIADRLEGREPIPQPQAIQPNVATPLPTVQPIARASMPPAKRRSNVVFVAVGIAAVLAVVLAGGKLLRHHADAPQIPVATVEQPLVSPEPKQAAPSPQEHPTQPHRPIVSEEEQTSKAPNPVPALIHPGTTHEKETETVARMPVGSPTRGEVAHQVMPEVLQAARKSIRGTVRVAVKVNVDRSGNVEDAELESRGPSRYFARAALNAAQDWKFKAPMVGGRGVLSTWTLRFEFTRDETKVVPVQEMP